MNKDASLSGVAEVGVAAAWAFKDLESVASISVDDRVALVEGGWVGGGENELSVSSNTAIWAWAGTVCWWLDTVDWWTTFKATSALLSACHDTVDVTNQDVTALNEGIC